MSSQPISLLSTQVIPDTNDYIEANAPPVDVACSAGNKIADCCIASVYKRYRKNIQDFDILANEINALVDHINKGFAFAGTVLQVTRSFTTKERGLKRGQKNKIEKNCGLPKFVDINGIKCSVLRSQVNRRKVDNNIPILSDTNSCFEGQLVICIFTQGLKSLENNNCYIAASFPGSIDETDLFFPIWNLAKNATITKIEALKASRNSVVFTSVSLSGTKSFQKESSYADLYKSISKLEQNSNLNQNRCVSIFDGSDNESVESESEVSKRSIRRQNLEIRSESIQNAEKRDEFFGVSKVDYSTTVPVSEIKVQEIAQNICKNERRENQFRFKNVEQKKKVKVERYERKAKRQTSASISNDETSEEVEMENLFDSFVSYLMGLLLDNFLSQNVGLPKDFSDFSLDQCKEYISYFSEFPDVQVIPYFGVVSSRLSDLTTHRGLVEAQEQVLFQHQEEEQNKMIVEFIDLWSLVPEKVSLPNRPKRSKIVYEDVLKATSYKSKKFNEAVTCSVLYWKEKQGCLKCEKGEVYIDLNALPETIPIDVLKKDAVLKCTISRQINYQIPYRCQEVLEVISLASEVSNPIRVVDGLDGELLFWNFKTKYDGGFGRVKLNDGREAFFPGFIATKHSSLIDEITKFQSALENKKPVKLPTFHIHVQLKNGNLQVSRVFSYDFNPKIEKKETSNPIIEVVETRSVPNESKGLYFQALLRKVEPTPIEVVAPKQTFQSVCEPCGWNRYLWWLNTVCLRALENPNISWAQMPVYEPLAQESPFEICNQDENTPVNSGVTFRCKQEAHFIEGIVFGDVESRVEFKCGQSITKELEGVTFGNVEKDPVKSTRSKRIEKLFNYYLHKMTRVLEEEVK